MCSSPDTKPWLLCGNVSRHHAAAVLQVYRRSTTSQQDDALLFDEPDARHFVTLTRTKDWRYVLINSTSKLSSEVSTPPTSTHTACGTKFNHLTTHLDFTAQ